MAEGEFMSEISREPRLDQKSIEKALRTFTRYNRWRRGRDGVIDNPADIWLSIDVAIRLLRLARYDSQGYGD
jgi:hypothetical protein